VEPEEPEVDGSAELDLDERVLRAVERIPYGRVMSYGDVAAAAGLRSGRTVGRVLAMGAGDVPWHRVVRADGTCAPHIADEQVARLRAEGVRVAGTRVDLASARLRPGGV